jgi:transposase-like protein
VTDLCPACGADLRGTEIPPEQRAHYGGETHYSRLIGIVERDRVVRWRCPDCGSEWARKDGDL